MGIANNFNRICLPILAAFSVLGGCMDGPLLCEDEDRMLIVHLVDSRGEPVDSAVAALLDADDDTLYIAGRVTLAPGDYVLFEDSRRGLLTKGPNRVTAVFRKNGLQVSEAYVLTTDKCHFSKISGRDTVMLR